MILQLSIILPAADIPNKGKEDTIRLATGSIGDA